jgi:hypothetical protein
MYYKSDKKITSISGQPLHSFHLKNQRKRSSRAHHILDNSFLIPNGKKKIVNISRAINETDLPAYDSVDPAW